MASRGGVRQGRRGGAYSNRTDLMSAGKPLPVTSPTDQVYGQNAAMQQAQATVPMASQPGIPTPAPTPGGAGGAGQVAGPALAPPSPADHWLRPTERPNEPVTAGLPTGPGPGPEALGPLGQPTQQGVTAGGLLSRMAASPDAPDSVKALAAFTAAGNQ